MIYTGVNKDILKSLPNPNKRNCIIEIKTDEFTFIGVADQPDYASLHISFAPNANIIELKSLKLYLQQFRNITISYERLIGVLLEDLNTVYTPKILSITISCKPRGGISSRLTMDI